MPTIKLHTNRGHAPASPKDYAALLKAELVALCEARGLDSSGTKADLIKRLQEADA